MRLILLHEDVKAKLARKDRCNANNEIFGGYEGGYYYKGGG
jgi:hypothetical protein